MGLAFVHFDATVQSRFAQGFAPQPLRGRGPPTVIPRRTRLAPLHAGLPSARTCPPSSPRTHLALTPRGIPFGAHLPSVIPHGAWLPAFRASMVYTRYKYVATIAPNSSGPGGDGGQR